MVTWSIYVASISTCGILFPDYTMPMIFKFAFTTSLSLNGKGRRSKIVILAQFY